MLDFKGIKFYGIYKLYAFLKTTIQMCGQLHIRSLAVLHINSIQTATELLETMHNAL